MGDHSESNRIQSLFESTLQDYESKTGVILVEHPFTLQLQNCDSVESATTFLRQEARASSDFQGWDRIVNAITSTVSILFRLFTTAVGAATIGSVRQEVLMKCQCFTSLIFFRSHSHPRQQYLVVSLSYFLYVISFVSLYVSS